MTSWIDKINYDAVASKLTELIKDTPTWKLATGGGLILIGSYYVFFKGGNKPPGPRGYPILGILPFLDPSAPHLSVCKLAEKYGDICSMSLLKDDFVLVSGEKYIQEIYVHRQDDFSDRLRNVRISTVLNGLRDITSMDDDEKFRDIKKLTMRSLKTYGEGMERVENISNEVIGNFLDYLENSNGKPIELKKKLKDVFGDIITSMVLNQKVSETTMQKFVEIYDAIFQRTLNPFTAIIEYFPWLKYFGNSTFKKLREMAQFRDNLMTPIVKKAIDDYDSEDIKTAIHQIMKFMNQSKVKYEFNDIYSVVIVLIIAGFITTSSTLHGFFPILMAHKEVQKKILKEISDTIGFHRHPKLEDRASMPYTDATILEAHRILSILPFSLPHVTTKNTTLGGYDLKKGTTIWPNIWGLHHDEKIWGDPWNFRPERFLDENGQVLSVEHRLRKWYVFVKNTIMRNDLFINKCFLCTAFYHLVPAEECAWAKIWQIIDFSCS